MFFCQGMTVCLGGGVLGNTWGSASRSLDINPPARTVCSKGTAIPIPPVYILLFVHIQTGG